MIVRSLEICDQRRQPVAWSRVFRSLQFCFAFIMCICLSTVPCFSQLLPIEAHGKIVDQEGNAVVGARVVLKSVSEEALPSLTTTSDNLGEFHFEQVPVGPLAILVEASGFQSQSVRATAISDQTNEIRTIILKIEPAKSNVTVSAQREELDRLEKQRLIGILPTFYTEYEWNAPPLTAKNKFELAARSTFDPGSVLFDGISAGYDQATNGLSGYGQGAVGFGKRFGAHFADDFTSSLIGDAALSAWWKQDPRYFRIGRYRGEKLSARIVYALKMSFLCRGDNGETQFNYSQLVGTMASGAISSTYYPPGDRGIVKLTITQAGVQTLASAFQNILQEFVFTQFTPSRTQLVMKSNKTKAH